MGDSQRRDGAWWRRRLLTSLLLGVLTTFAVGWAFAIVWTLVMDGTDSFADGPQGWPVSVPSDWPAYPTDQCTRCRSWGIVEYVYAGGEKQSEQYFSVLCWQYGWPFTSTQSTWRFVNRERPGGGVFPRELVWGSVWEQGPRWFFLVRPVLPDRIDEIDAGTDGLPIEPVWPGFSINILIYSAIWWALLVLPGVERRRRRRWRGVCEKCRYALGDGQRVCPECGRARQEAEGWWSSPPSRLRRRVFASLWLGIATPLVVAVAFAVAWEGSSPDMFEARAGSKAWPASVPRGWPSFDKAGGAYELEVSERGAFGASYWQGSVRTDRPWRGGYQSLAEARGDVAVLMRRRAYGWPWRTLHIVERGNGTPRYHSLLTTSWIPNGVPIPEWLDRTVFAWSPGVASGHEERRFPIQPAWTGVLLSTLVYGPLWFGVLTAPSWVRAKRADRVTV